MPDPVIKDPAARGAHEEIHGLGTVLETLKAIDGVASDILTNADWSRATEIRDHVINARNAIDASVMRTVEFIKKREKFCKGCSREEL